MFTNFKKKKLQAKNKKPHKAVSFFWVFAILWIFFLASIVLVQIGNWNFNLYNSIISHNTKKVSLSPEEKKKQDIEKKLQNQIKEEKENNENKINVLIVWRWWYGNDAPELTDSIILASFHKKMNHISMLSIPRDLYVEFWDTNKYGKLNKWKINGLYVHYLAKYQNKEKAIKKLQEKITEITGEKIDHYINLDFRWFIKLIDSLWWITIDVPKALVDYKYPNNTHWYQVFSIKKWVQKLYGSKALKYVRTRKNTGWDFGRSERQQQVITALKDKMLSWWYLTSPTKIKELYTLFSKYLTTDVWIVKAVQIFTQIKLSENTKVYSSWFNATCIKRIECDTGWYLYYPQRQFFGWQSVLLPEWAWPKNLNNFESLQEYSKIVFNSPKLFEENYKISIFSIESEKENALELQEELKKLWFIVNMWERIGPISTQNNMSWSTLWNKKVSLLEYNENKNKSWTWTDKPLSFNIESESNNTQTKLIVNRLEDNNLTLWILQRYLGVWEDNIEENHLEPKYARDTSTNIEIIYIKK